MLATCPNCNNLICTIEKSESCYLVDQNSVYTCKGCNKDVRVACSVTLEEDREIHEFEDYPDDLIRCEQDCNNCVLEETCDLAYFDEAREQAELDMPGGFN